MPRLHHFLTALLAASLLLAACGGQPAAEAPEPTTPPAAAAPDLPAADQDASECDDGLRLASHAFGTACISERPERVATNVETLVTNLLLLGIQPLTGPEDQAGWNAPYVSLFPDSVSIDAIIDSGVTEETNLETVLLADPEVIMTYEYSGETLYDNFSEIAPTIIVERGENGEWRERFDREAAYLGREAEAAEVIARYEAALEELAGFTDLTIAFVRRPESGTFRMDAQGSFPGSVMEDAGLNYVTAPEGVGEFDGSSVQNISEERLDILADADIIVTPDWREAGFSDEPDVTGLSQFALWETLPAVQNDGVLVVPGPVYNGGNYAAAQLLVETIAEAVADVEPAAAVEDTSGTCDQGFRPFTHYGGETCVPEDPQRIVTTQDQNGLLPLLELGVEPVGSAGHLLEDGSFQFRRVQGYDTSGIEFIGSYWGEGNIESIARLQPDLIVSHEFAQEFYDLHSQVAPAVMIQIFDRPLPAALMDFADLVGRTERAEELQAAYTERVDGLIEALGDRKETMSVSVITAGENPSEFYRADQGQAVGTVMNDLDLLRPEAEQHELEEREYLSIETLPEHDADVILVFDFSGEEQDPNFDAFVNAPIFTALAASQAGQVYVIDGTQTVGAAWGKMDVFLAELERILLDPALDVAVVQE